VENVWRTLVHEWSSSLSNADGKQASNKMLFTFSANHHFKRVVVKRADRQSACFRFAGNFAYLYFVHLRNSF